MRALAALLLASLPLPGRADGSRSGDHSAQPSRAHASEGAGGRSGGPARADTFVRASGESADSFARRYAPAGSEVVHAVIETDAWQPGRPAVVAFYRHETANPPVPAGDGIYLDVTGYAYLPDSARRYRRVPIGLIEHDGADPEIRSVFFANADREPGRELIVIVGWQIRSAFVEGTVYATYVYAKRPAPGADRFVYLGDVSTKVSGGCECWREGKPEVSRFKTAAEVKAALREMGYG